MDETTLNFGTGLMIYSRPWVVTARGSFSPPPTDSKGKRAFSLSPVKKAKKNKGLAHPSDFTPGPDEPSISRVEVGGEAFQDMEGIAQLGLDKAREAGENELVSIIEARA